MSRPGQAVKGAAQAVDLLDADSAASFGAWVAQAEAMLLERHRLIHSVWMMRAVSPDVGEYVGRHPRSQTGTDPDPVRLREIADRLESCTNDGFRLIWSPRLMAPAVYLAGMSGPPKVFAA